MRHPTQGSIPAYNKRDPTLHWTLSCLQNKLEGILRHIWDGDIQTWYHINNKKKINISHTWYCFTSWVFVQVHVCISSWNQVVSKLYRCERQVWRLFKNSFELSLQDCPSVFFSFSNMTNSRVFFFCENIFKSSKICEINKQTNK